MLAASDCVSGLFFDLPIDIWYLLVYDGVMAKKKQPERVQFTLRIEKSLTDWMKSQGYSMNAFIGKLVKQAKENSK